ncbi:hypothetical protein EK21DRAFT_52289 [Setomelanomma holmii]|uniref:Zn(2)-C6 fungal-type domain-containing protein n=1 Tax=Setomelanomma holmii TaxID=210430 RepID=A0A9P4HJ31_9PLEO|nr:hypothetical protein EK21DRAFT_52289 [Setomelanomma holmii]
MENMADDNMPPRPECEFDFNLPHGVDMDADMTTNTNNEPSLVPNLHEDPTPQHAENDDDSLNDLSNDPGNHEVHHEPGTSDRNSPQQAMNYDTFAQGFSDDEGGEEAFNRSWTAHQARKPSPKKKKKKSPRRSADEDTDDESSPRPKKPRKSLFGGVVEEIKTQEEEVYVDSQGDTINAPKTLGHGIGSGIAILNLHEQYAQDDRPFNLGFGLGSSDRDSMSPVRSRAPSEESIIIPSDDQPVYELRQNIDRAKAFTYIDTDKTGDYDPAQEARLKTLRLQRAKAAKAAKKKGKGKEKAPKQYVMKCIVRLSFKAFGNVRNYTNDEDNWPENWSEVNSDYERETQDIRSFYRRNTPDLDPQPPIEDPRGNADDLTGHPVARGCRNCRKEEKTCSMTYGGLYPCDECEDDDIDCQPILPYVVKGRCKQCEENGEERCSFEDDSSQALCHRRIESELSCEALPPQGYKTPRISIDEIMYSANRKHVQCTFCRMEKKRCSLREKTDKPPCKFCKKNGIGCIFYDLPTLPNDKRSGSKQKAPVGPTDGAAPEVSKPGSELFSPADLKDIMNNDEAIRSREATPEIEMEDDSGNKGMLTKINTSFAHPIKFSGIFHTTKDCNFCEMPVFGFVGYFETEVHVIRWYSGLGYTELGGGHREVSDETTMCQKCSMGRAQIVSCDQHDIQPVYDANTAPEFDGLLTELLSSEEGSALLHHQLQRWCSMCFSPANFICCARQPSLMVNDHGEDFEIEGCGLRLCASCEVTLWEVFEGNSSHMAAAMDLGSKAKEGDEDLGARQIRADVGFLSHEGLLWKAFGYDMEQGELDQNDTTEMDTAL